LKTAAVKTNKKEQWIDITSEVQKAVQESGIVNGTVTVFVPHTTAGITINENADPDVVRDILFALNRAVPDRGFHHFEGNSAAHVKATATGFSVTVIVRDGRLMLGTWQGIYFAEFDGPRQRKVYIQTMITE